METAQISAEIARRLASRRRELGLSLAQVSARCGVSLQQVHKYETGFSVISAPMLWKLSRCLDAPITYFFQTLEGLDPAPSR